VVILPGIGDTAAATARLFSCSALLLAKGRIGTALEELEELAKGRLGMALEELEELDAELLPQTAL